MCPYSVHAGGAEPHDGRVCYTRQHRLQRPVRVEPLRFQELVHKGFTEHGSDDVVHNCSGKTDMSQHGCLATREGAEEEPVSGYTSF